MRAFVSALSRIASLVLAFGLMMGLLLGLAGTAEAAPFAGTPVGPGTPLSFSPLPEVHQTGPRFDAQAPSGKFTFDRTGYSLLIGGSMPAPLADGTIPDREPSGVRMQFFGSTGASLSADHLPSEVIHDFAGPGPKSWRIAAPAYGLLTYRQLYRGIDLQYEGLPGRFKGTYTVAPGADPATIRWRYQGAASVEISQAGELWVELPGRPVTGAYLIEGAPLAWQEVGGRKVIVAAEYRMNEDGSISYELGAYDTSRPLVIDPIVSLSQ